MGKYLHEFVSRIDFLKKYFGDDYLQPWASLTTSNYQSDYNRKKRKLSKMPLTTVPLTNDSTTFTFAIAANVNTDTLQSISYSVDGGETWTKTNNVDGTAVNITVTVTNKQPVMFIGEGDAISVSESVYSKITANQNFAAFGNPLSLLSQRYRLNSLLNHPFALSHLFSTAEKLVYADGIILSAKKCGNNCYSRMFENCYLLETFPELPAVSLADYSYYYMFQNCRKIITPPDLPATKLGAYCYSYMFTGCTGLTSIPELPAMNLYQYCYQRMFNGCTGLVDCEINLPAVTMAQYCYQYMFNGCNKLVTVPELPATSLAPHCYEHMFDGCTVLPECPELPVINLEALCYNGMFYSCNSLTTLPNLPATDLKDQCYKDMFRNCKGFTDLSGYTFPVITSGGNAYVFMFQGCSNLTKAPVLPTTTLTGNYFYRGMFRDCTSLIEAPELPATVGTQWCYAEMFYGCTSLTTMPTIHLTSLYDNCFREMFRNCTSLVNITNSLPWTTLKNGCYLNMFHSCTSITSAPELPAETLIANCYSGMFYNCSNLQYISCKATDISASGCTTNWVYGVSDSGAFIVNNDEVAWTYGVNGIPTNWNKFVYDTTNVITENYSLNFSKPEASKSINIVFNNMYTYSISNSNNWIQDINIVENTTTGNITNANLNFNILRNETSSERTGTFNINFYDSGNTLVGSSLITIIQGALFYSVNLNDQWVEYEANKYNSNTGSYHVSNGVSTMYITIDGYSEFKLKVKTYGESNYDYLTVSELDKTPTRGNSTGGSSGNIWTGYGKSSASTWYDVIFSNIDGKEHTITIMYSKDDSVNNGDDRGYVEIIG